MPAPEARPDPPKAEKFFGVNGGKWNAEQSELTVITRAKDLCSYIMTVTQRSPKEFRFTFTSRLQNLALDTIENLYRANDVYVRKGDEAAIARRLTYQHRAMTDIRLTMYMAELAMTQQAILPKQFEQISMQGAACLQTLAAWTESDKKRFGP